MYRHGLFPMNLQLFAEDPGTGTGGAVGGTGSEQGNQNSQGVQVDYERIQQMLNGTLAAKEDTALKADFK